MRQSDSDVVQVSIRPYDTEADRENTESKKIHFLMGNSAAIYNTIKNILNNDGVVLTRTWAAAFDYIQGVGPATAIVSFSLSSSSNNGIVKSHLRSVSLKTVNSGFTTSVLNFLMISQV